MLARARTLLPRQRRRPGEVDPLADGLPVTRFDGWRMTALAGFVVFCAAPGMTYGVAAFVDPFTQDLGMSRSLFALAYAMATLFSAFVLLAAGKQIDRWGGRLTMAMSAVGLALGVLVLSSVHTTLAVFVGFGLIRTFGQGILPLAARIIIPFWFLRQRGRAFSLIGIAGTLSIATMPPLHEWLIGQIGWRQTWRLDALFLVVVVTPIILLFVRNRPEDVGQRPDGIVPAHPAVAVDHDELPGLSLREAMRTSAFWGLVVISAVGFGITSGLALNQVAIFEDLGYPGSLAALTFTIESAAMFGVTILLGAIIDRVPLRWAMAFSQLVLLAAMLVLLNAHGFALGALYAALRGTCMAILMLSLDVAWPSYFGRRHLGSIRGVGAAVGVFGTALGPLPLGIAFDRLGSYAPAIVGMLALPAVAGALVAMARPPMIDDDMVPADTVSVVTEFA
ncbi:MAG: MFS transporter [Thermomicrobiales bacterium]